MVIRELQLRHFRNFSLFETDFHSGINFIYGKNGQGKTNLIESLYIITHLKSFRTACISDLCQNAQKTASISTTLLKQGVLHEVRVYLQENLKSVLHNQKNIYYSSDYIKNFFSILFAPDLLTAFKEFPLVRRNFVDRVLFLIDPQYLKAIKDYNRIRKQKNSLLREHQKTEIDSWNWMISETVPKIIFARRSIADQINTVLPQLFQRLTGKSEPLSFHYRSDFEGRTKITASDIFAFLTSKLETEVLRGHACYGIHKDNYWMQLDERGNRSQFSQGEYRISFIALQLAINEIIIERMNLHSILLLDDIFSELDQETGEKILEVILSTKNQVFISSTAIPKSFQGIGRRFQIRQGSLIEEG